MYCPRCGAPNTETTKFCRQCGLALMEVTNYVATGGTSALTPSGATAAPVAAGFTPKQKMWLAIISFIMLPASAAIIGEASHDNGFTELVVPLCAILMLIGIPASVMYFRNQAKLLAHPQSPPQPYPLPQQAYVSPQPQAWLQASVMPVSAVPASDMPRTTPNTNPLAQPISVTEDETKRLPNQ